MKKFKKTTTICLVSGSLVVVLACSGESPQSDEANLNDMTGTGAESSATGGASTGAGPDSNTGGLSDSGGSVATGGETDGGGANNATGGSGGSVPTMGCGSTPPESGRFSIDVSGTEREYILTLPDDYDSAHPYRLIFVWHPRGGSAEQVVTGFDGGYNGLESRADGNAIFVAPDGLSADGSTGWANSGGGDIAFAEVMLDRFESELCIDENRIFSTGFSYGGMMSFAVGCAMGDVFRAIAPVAGALYSGCQNGDFPIAVWGAHGDDDEIVPITDGRSGRDVFLERNNCGSETTPIEPSPCVTYEGCDAGYPVTWCEFSGGHAPPGFSADAIWDFFSQF